MNLGSSLIINDNEESRSCLIRNRNSIPAEDQEDDEQENISDDSHVHVEIPESSSSLGRIFLQSGRQSTREGTGWLNGSILIVNAALGAGLLNFPHAFHESGGIYIATTVQSALMGFIVPALVIFAYCSEFNGARTLQDVLLYTWGKCGKRVASICIAIYCFGTCITFIIIIGDQFDRVFASLYGPEFCRNFYMNRSFTMSISSLFFILPFCYPKKIDFLKYISSVGVLAIIYTVFLIIFEYYDGKYIPGPIKTDPEHWTDIFLAIPAITFGYQCHVSVIPIYSCFKERNLKNFNAAAILAIFICIFTYSVAASYGYLTFGDKISSDILENYNARDPLVIVAIIAIAIKSYSTYPILLFCGREAVSNIWLDLDIYFGRLERDSVMEERFRRVTIATIWFVFTIILSILLPNISVVIKLLGSLAVIFIFIFPGLCLIKIALKEDTTQTIIDYKKVWRKQFLLLSISGLFLSVGAFIFGTVLTQAIIANFINEPIQEIPLCHFSLSTNNQHYYSFLDSVHLYKNKSVTI